MKQVKKDQMQSRKIAAKLYGLVIEQKLSLAGLTDEAYGASAYLALDKQNRNFVKAILASSLRHKLHIEHLLKSYLKTPLPKGAKNLTNILHISIAQLIYLNISHYAIINIAVDLAKYDARTRRFANLINAILREISRDIEKGSIKDKLTLPIIQTVPSWFSNMLIQDYGKAKAQRIIEAHNIKSAIDLTVKEDPQFWAARLNAFIIWGNNLRLNAENKEAINLLEGFAEGAWWIQDCAAYLPAMFMGHIKNAKIADLCAAPGGKTAQLAQKGALVWAYESNEKRFARLNINLARLNYRVETILGDFQEKAPHDFFDMVLLDAPCSSTGTIRKNIDILWTKSEEDIKSLSDLQYKLLIAAIRCVKKGGEIFFSNCSLAKLEGEYLLSKLLQEQNNIELSPFSANEPFLQQYPALKQFITEEGFFRITPDDFPSATACEGAMDGFFIARLRKINK